jgi:DNA polymerase III delta prime subunit
MSELLIQKYQPKYFDDFETNHALYEIIRNLFLIDKLNIMLIGNIGCGKTTVINAIIREYYHPLTPKEYNDNILVINNLKEQGISYYRTEVKTFCQTASSIHKKKKLVILDDIDFINEQSQQVFRNCIDKYSQNVNFISTCNNKQKVIESLQSRFFILHIKSLERNNIKTIMNRIIETEGLKIDTPSQDFILDICNNNAKTLVNYMEKIKLLNMPIALNEAMNICTNISYIYLTRYTELVKHGDLKNAISLFNDLYDKGYSVMDILDNYFLFIKTTSSLTEEEKYRIVPVLCKYISVFHNIHEDDIELALFTNNVIQTLNKI